MLRKGLPGIPAAERGYRAFWWRKGDVFRLLMSLQNVIDGCTWPTQDERAVQQLQGFIHHVTGASSPPPQHEKACKYFNHCAWHAQDKRVMTQLQGFSTVSR